VCRKDGRDQIRIQLVQLGQEVTDVTLAPQVQGHVDGRRGIVRVDDHDGLAQVFAQANGGIERHRSASGTALRGAEDDDAAGIRLTNDGLRRHNTMAEHLAKSAEQFVTLDGLQDKGARTRQYSSLGQRQRVR